MMTTGEIIGLRPFHETIVEAIERAEGREFDLLARLIKMTRIPRGHDGIIAAWQKRQGVLSDTLCFGVLRNLLEQKRAAEASEKRASITLDELEQKTIGLLDRLHLHLCPSARQDPSHDWNGFMFKELLPEMEKLHDLLSRALGK